MRSWHIPLFASLLLCLEPRAASAEKTPWAAAMHPAKGSASAIGGYSRGCVRGAKALALDGTGYQVMRPRRRRYFGHPRLLEYIEDIAKKIADKKLGPILVGDLGQPMGGPSPHGHASHQSGLDVDIWFWHPKKAERRKLSKRERQTLSAHRVVEPKKKTFTRYWSDEVEGILRVAAMEPEVSRIFVNPLIKKRLCENLEGDRAYLHKIRPWYGHADHMHVRLACPKDSEHCEDQKELPEGDGCEELDWWLDDEAQAARKKGKKKYLSTVGATPELPEQCTALLE